MVALVQEIQESRTRLREDVEAFLTKGGQARKNLHRATRRSGQLVGEASRELWSALLHELKALRELVTPHRFERELLVRAQAGLASMEATAAAWEERIGQRIDEIAELTHAQPIDDYDRLSAKEIIAKLPKLAPDEREAIVLYERTHKKRATILKAAS